MHVIVSLPYMVFFVALKREKGLFRDVQNVDIVLTA